MKLLLPRKNRMRSWERSWIRARSPRTQLLSVQNGHFKTSTAPMKDNFSWHSKERLSLQFILESSVLLNWIYFQVNSIQTDRGNEDKATPNDQNLKAKHNQDSVHNLEVSPSSKSGLEVEKNLEQKKDSWMPQILGLTALGLAGALTAWSQYIRQKTWVIFESWFWDEFCPFVPSSLPHEAW